MRLPNIFYRKATTRFVVLGAENFRKAYGLSFATLNLDAESAKNAFLTEMRLVQDSVHDALAKRWSGDDEDFGVMWDFDYCHHACGGIYSERIFSSHYIDTVEAAMLHADPERKWTFHTCCEILVNPKARTAGERLEDRGEFFLRAGTCYINGDRTIRHWRQRLGCSI